MSRKLVRIIILAVLLGGSASALAYVGSQAQRTDPELLATVEERPGDLPPKALDRPLRSASDPALAITAEGLLELTNQSRAQAGVQQLVLLPELNASALDKCHDMVRRNYFAHIDPSGDQPWKFIKSYIKYAAAGENLAAGYLTAADVHNGWMKSEGHRKNIEKPIYDRVGYGICYGEDFAQFGASMVVVQHFIQQK